MKRILYLVLFCMIINPSLKSQLTLTIVIKNLESNEGSLLLDFRDSNDQKLKDFTKIIIDKQCIITMNELRPGKYSFKYFHDMNNNKKLDTYWIGAPKEGFGFSNNVKGRFGFPDFAKTIFEIVNDTTIECTPDYFKF